MKGYLLSVAERCGTTYVMLGDGQTYPVKGRQDVPGEGTEVEFTLHRKGSSRVVTSIRPAVYEDEAVRMEVETKTLLSFRGGVA